MASNLARLRFICKRLFRGMQIRLNATIICIGNFGNLVSIAICYLQCNDDLQ